MRLTKLICAIGLMWVWLPLAASWAGEADVIEVSVSAQGQERYRFDVAVAHADSGWEHYADRWEVLAPDCTLLATRTLMHPHVDEQPFTRSLSGVAIPGSIDGVEVRAHDTVHSFVGKTVTVKLPRE